VELDDKFAWKGELGTMIHSTSTCLNKTTPSTVTLSSSYAQPTLTTSMDLTSGAVSYYPFYTMPSYTYSYSSASQNHSTAIVDNEGILFYLATDRYGDYRYYKAAYQTEGALQNCKPDSGKSPNYGQITQRFVTTTTTVFASDTAIDLMGASSTIVSSPETKNTVLATPVVANSTPTPVVEQPIPSQSQSSSSAAVGLGAIINSFIGNLGSIVANVGLDLISSLTEIKTSSPTTTTTSSPATYSIYVVQTTSVIGGITSISGGSTTVIGGSTTIKGGVTSVVGGSASVENGITSMMGGSTMTVGGTPTVIGGSTSVMGGSTSIRDGTTVVSSATLTAFQAPLKSSSGMRLSVSLYSYFGPWMVFALLALL